MNIEQQRTCVRGTVSGRVQGVGFRYFVVRNARRIGVGGWVRNNPDGTVSFEVSGSHSDVEALVELVRVGPRSSNVESVQLHTLEPGESSASEVEFTVR